MSANLTWIDFSEKDRRKMLDVIALFKERDTRDELGLGSIRDAFAELFFPGSSTIQTRARYFLFVPWIYKRREQLKTPSGRIAELARADEIYLINALVKGGESEGVIGIDAGKTLQRLPSVIYWAGLGSWGIRKFPASRAQYHRSLDHFYRRAQFLATDDLKEPVFGDVPVNWDPALPEVPGELLYETSLKLSRIEAEYLQEKIQLNCGRSLLAHLIDKSKPVGREVAFLWLHPDRGGFPPTLEEIVEHSRRFSEVMHGAALLYNLMLAERGGYANREEEYREWFGSWASRVRNEETLLGGWDLKRFWRIVTSQGARVSYRTQQFVMTWIGLVRQVDNPDGLAESLEARNLVEEREFSLKRGRARLRDTRRLELWGGASGSAPLEFRWSTARTLVNDILYGLGRK